MSTRLLLPIKTCCPICKSRGAGWWRVEHGAKFDYVREGEILRCPRHNYCFDVKTGLCLTEPQKFRVKTYPILVEEQEVFLDL